jgi:hypothetical protein
MYIDLHVEDFHQVLVKLEFLRQTFEKYSNTKFHENPSSGRRVVPGGRTADRHDEIINFKLFVPCIFSTYEMKKPTDVNI